MTRDDIIRIAQEAGLTYAPQAGWIVGSIQRLEAFAALVAAHERAALAEHENEGGSNCTASQRMNPHFTNTINPIDFPKSKYTAPPQRKPLTEAQIYAAIKGIDSLKAVEVARAIERAHGIGGNDE